MKTKRTVLAVLTVFLASGTVGPVFGETLCTYNVDLSPFEQFLGFKPMRLRFRDQDSATAGARHLAERAREWGYTQVFPSVVKEHERWSPPNRGSDYYHICVSFTENLPRENSLPALIKQFDETIAKLKDLIRKIRIQSGEAKGVLRHIDDGLRQLWAS